MKQAETSFHVGVKGVIFRNNRIFALQYRTPSKEIIWDLPGGRIQNNESIEEALKRELAEELPGIKNINIKRLVYADKRSDYNNNGHRLIRLFFLITATLPKTINISDEHVSHSWLSPHDLKQPDLQAFFLALKEENK